MIRKNTPFLRLFSTFFLIIFLSSCGPFKPAPSDARKVPPNVDERVRKNIEEGKGFRLMGGQKKVELLILQALMSFGEPHWTQ